MEVFDRALALRNAQGDEALLSLRCSAFIGQAPRRLELLGKALDGRNARQLADTAREIQRAAAEIGAEGVDDLGRRLLDAAAASDWVEAGSLLTKLDMEIGWLSRILDEHMCSGNL